MDEPSRRPPIEKLADAVLDSYRAQESIRKIEEGTLPNRYKAIALLELLRDLVFPGYYSDKSLSWDTVRDHVIGLLADVREELESQVRVALRYRTDGKNEAAQAASITDAFIAQIPAIRALLAQDVRAAVEGDPAASSDDETIYCYPGIDALFSYRVAHALHVLGVPLLPRIITEYVHNETGIDIHPAAKIGHSCFIDHGTGVVIGETAVIGNRVRLYQGVTLGALTVDAVVRPGIKRHPTLEDDVTVYSNTTILGGQTIIGAASTIGGSVFLTESVPPGHLVTANAPELTVRALTD